MNELIRELHLIVRAGAWRHGIATQLTELGFMAALADPHGELYHHAEPAAIAEMLDRVTIDLDPDGISRPVRALRHLLGLSISGRYQLLKIRRGLAAGVLDKQVSTFRTEYEAALIESLSWEVLSATRLQ